MNHLLVAVAVASVVLLERLFRAERRRRAMARRLPPDEPVEEHRSESGRFRATVYSHDVGVMRVEVFQRLEDEGGEPRWRRVSGPSFVDREALPAMIQEALIREEADRAPLGVAYARDDKDKTGTNKDS